jgi:hypothetical protein
MLMNLKFEFVESLDKDQLRRLNSILHKDLLELDMLVEDSALNDDRYHDYMILRREEMRILKDQVLDLLLTNPEEGGI